MAQAYSENNHKYFKALVCVKARTLIIMHHQHTNGVMSNQNIDIPF
jgi:hypothetical protein